MLNTTNLIRVAKNTGKAMTDKTEKMLNVIMYGSWVLGLIAIIAVIICR